MKDRVFLLVVEDLDTDRLIASLEEMQLRYMGKFRELEERREQTTMSSEPSPPNKKTRIGSLAAMAPTLKFFRSKSAETSPSVTEKVNEEGAGGGGVKFVFNEEESRNFFKQFPMEFVALELLVCGAFEVLDSDVSLLEKTFSDTSKSFAAPTSIGGQNLHFLKNHSEFYKDRVMLFHKVFDEIISNPEDMIRMELSRQTAAAAASLTAVAESYELSEVSRAIDANEVRSLQPRSVFLKRSRSLLTLANWIVAALNLLHRCLC